MDMTHGNKGRVLRGLKAVLWQAGNTAHSQIPHYNKKLPASDGLMAVVYGSLRIVAISAI
jgi:hypothetical protein